MPRDFSRCKKEMYQTVESHESIKNRQRAGASCARRIRQLFSFRRVEGQIRRKGLSQSVFTQTMPAGLAVLPRVTMPFSVVPVQSRARYGLARFLALKRLVFRDLRLGVSAAAPRPSFSISHAEQTNGSSFSRELCRRVAEKTHAPRRTSSASAAERCLKNRI